MLCSSASVMAKFDVSAMIFVFIILFVCFFCFFSSLLFGLIVERFGTRRRRRRMNNRMAIMMATLGNKK